MPLFLDVEKLTKRFGGLVAVDNVSFQMEREEITGIIGPNGAGKTTLIRLIMGILKPNGGKVRFKGEDITGKPPWEVVGRGIAITHQVVKPFRNLPIISNVIIGCLGKGASKRGEWVKRIEVRAREALEFCGIADLAKEPAFVLSHGDLKRLEIARALATDPELLILDEPFGGLNPAETDLIARSIKRLHKGGRFGRLHSEGPAMIIIEHKLTDLMKIVERVIVLNFGKIIAEGVPQDVVVDKEVIEAYLGSKEVLRIGS
jgi:branched-chain amino acid transport system ATP-binding protein